MEDVFPQGRIGGSRRGHEPNTIGVRGIIICTIALFGTGIAIQAVFGLVMKHFADEEHRLDSLYPSRNAIDVDQFPTPQVQKNPAVDLAGMRAEEQRRVNAYGWVDRKAGIAHIPIERAMDILAKTGLPKVAAPAPVAGVPPRTFIPPGTKREEPKLQTDQPQSKQGQKP
ncbi:MAG: hypothetical protein JO114_02650 [Planctomycetaceae bacterium]|nr:hypothetical protein [Planctomycetaceae bacterium]MBV8310172.1 hypothetical protein [Planctomycetaceae bacterium]